MILIDLRDAIIAAIQTAAPALKEVKPHGGRFSLEELKSAAARSPSVRVACLGLSRIEPGASCVQATVSWGAFVIAADQIQLTRDAAVLGIVAALAPIIALNSFGLDDQVDSARDVRGDNLFSRAIDRQGVAMWALTWRHTVDLNPVDIATLDDFLRAVATWTLAGGSDGPQDEQSLPLEDTAGEPLQDEAPSRPPAPTDTIELEGDTL